MKILFVEDELSKNIPRIIRLFSKYLGEERIQRLKSLEADEYGATPEEIKAIVEETNLIELDYRFSDALHKVIHHHNDYALFIMDRNLIENGYSLKEIVQIDSNYNDDFRAIEGDYIFHKLALQGIDIKNKFYYLTAVSEPKDIIKPYMIHFKNFETENFIEKGGSDFDRLVKIVENIPILKLQHENEDYLNILRKNIGNKQTDHFLKILENKDKPEKIEDNVRDMRNIYQEILTICAGKIPDMKRNCSDYYGNIVMGKKTIDWLFDNKHIRVIIKNFFYSISNIANTLSHPNKEAPTLNTVNSLVYALKDVILWFGKICSP